MTIKRKEDKICIAVEDTGVGIANTEHKNLMGSVKEISMGLASIQERIDMINKQQPGNQVALR